jgi:type I restriction enzyme, S subunit
VREVNFREVRRLKYAASINDEALSEETDSDFELKYIDIGNVDSSGVIHEIATYRFENAPSRARRIVRHGDVIVSTVRTYLQAIAAIENPPENLIVSTGFAVIRPMKGVLDARYCKYALRDPEFIAEVERQSVGVSYPAINASDIGNIYIHLPSIPEQQTVADLLDRETSRIDTLVIEKEKLLELIVEKRRSIITLAVTLGLNSNVSLRDSGLPWLGQIPEHWRIERAKWLFKERDERTENSNDELLTVSHITGVTPRSEKDVNMFEAETTEGYKICRRGDLAINTMWAWMGAMGVSPVDGIVSPSYNVYTPDDALLGGYLDVLVRTPQFTTEVTRFSKGVWSSRLRLYPEEFFLVWLPVPPLDEQRAIVEHIKAETKKLDDLRAETERTIGLLKERRVALIAAAVTGQLTVGVQA